MAQSLATVRSFMLNQTGTYQEQSIRPFQTHVSPEHINALAEHTQNGANIGIDSVQQVASDMIRPQATIEGMASINNGWTSRRFRFILKVDEHNNHFQTNSYTQRLFYGYTDHCDLSYTDRLDPNMRIYFNSEAQFAVESIPTPNGQLAHRSRILNTNQILSPYHAIDPGQMQGQHLMGSSSLYLLRPEDIFGSAATMEVARKANEGGFFDGAINNTWNQGAMVNNSHRYTYANREHTAPSRYLSETLKGYQHSLREQELEGDGDGNFDADYLFTRAGEHLRAPRFHTVGFFQMLKERTQFMQNGYVTLSEFNSCFPEADHVTDVIPDDRDSIRKLNTVEGSNHWQGSDDTTIAASLLAQVVPSLLMKNYMRNISFTVNNGDGPGTYAITPFANDTRMLVDYLDEKPYIQEFIRRLAIDVLDGITFRNQKFIQMSMFCDLAGESIIDISLGDDYNNRFVAPTFSDSLFSSMITQNHDHANSIAQDLSYVSREVIQPNHSMSQGNIIHPYTQQPISAGGHDAPQQPAYATNPQGDDNGHFGLL